MAGYPKPASPGWESKYRYAFAKDEVYTSLLTRIQAWAKEAKEIEKQEIEITKTIV